jgi:hypothetical protein
MPRYAASYAEEAAPALVITQLLSAAEVAQCHHAAAGVGSADPFAGGGLCEALTGRPHDVGYSDEHLAVYLHSGPRALNPMISPHR